MRIKFSTTIASHEHLFRRGKVYELDEERAAGFIREGIAAPDGPAAPPVAPPPPPETPPVDPPKVEAPPEPPPVEPPVAAEPEPTPAASGKPWGNRSNKGK